MNLLIVINLLSKGDDFELIYNFDLSEMNDFSDETIKGLMKDLGLWKEELRPQDLHSEVNIEHNFSLFLNVFLQ